MTRKSAFITFAILLFSVLVSAQVKQPRTVRDFFMALPDKYFSLDCCLTKPRSKRKSEFLKRHLAIEDTANGYLSALGDGAQDGCVMALFKRPNGTYIIGFYTEGEGGVEDTPGQFFLITVTANGPICRAALSLITVRKNTFTRCRDTESRSRSMKKMKSQ